MRLRNVLIAVIDMDRAIRFYKEIFGLQVILDQDGNVILSEGLVLQDAAIWKKFLDRDLIPKNNMAELYFEEPDIEGFVKKLEESDFEIEFVNKLMTHSWGQKVVRFYDPDGHLIEVGESMDFVARRFLQQGYSIEETAAKTQMAYKKVEEIAALLYEPEE